jgi:uncharacterized protein (DUF58 family)
MPEPSSSPSCFDSEFLQTLEYLSLVSRRAFLGSLLAARRSLRSGGGIEFADHRGYTETDDFRYLDWNLFARSGQLMVKRFQEEQDLRVYVLLDSSRSMGLGQPPKFDYARRLTAALAYIALVDLDRVSVTAFAAQLGDEFPLSRGKECLLGLLQFLDGLQTHPDPTELARASAAFVDRHRHPGLVVVISDWFDRAGFVRALDLLRHHRHEVHVIQLFDPAEANPSVLGDYELFDIERRSRRKVTITERSVQRYRKLFQEFQDGLRAYCLRHALGCGQTSTAIPFDEFLIQMMRTAGVVR